MGLSVSASVAILFTALVISAVVLYGTIENALDDLQDAGEYESQNEQRQARSQVEFVSVDELAERSFLLTVRNTGDTQMRIRQGDIPLFEVLINGYLVTENISGETIRVEGSSTTTIFNPTEEMSFVVEGHKLTTGDVVKILFYEACTDYEVYE